MTINLNDELREEIALGELAKLYMAGISKHFLETDTLTKQRFLQIEEESISKFKETLERSKRLNHGV
jgi:lipoate-protein ligase A